MESTERRSMMKDMTSATTTIIGSMIILVLTFGAWLTHIVTCIKAGSFLFMIVGALIPPVAIFHGWATWMGYVWI